MAYISKPKYSVTNNGTLAARCVKHQWFTCGTPEQYEKMFIANQEGATIEEIASMIWICSDDTVARRDVLQELLELHEEYLKDYEAEQVLARLETED